MKIVFLASRSGHTIKWINSLAKSNNEVHWITQDVKHEKNNVVDNRVIIHQLFFKSKVGYYLNLFELRRLLRQINPDIVNAHNASGYGTLIRLANFHPYVLNSWGSDVFNMKNAGYERMVIKNLKAADALASTSNGMANQIKKLLQDDSLKVYITPFGVDLERYNYNKYLIEKKDDSIVIGVVKTLAPKYGIKMLIEAFAIVQNSLTSNEISKKLVFKIYGDGPQRKELEKLSHNIGMEKKIHFMGRIPNNEVPEALSEMDIFCLGSECDSESFGVAAVEAMAMKIPVIATDVTGFKEVIVDNESGILIRRGDSELMAKTIIKLILDEEERKRLGENGRMRVEKEYDLALNLQTMIHMYDDVIRKDK